MESQKMQETQKRLPAQNTKDRLNELKELLDGGYITELEFKIARVNILKEGEIDVIIRQHHSQWFSSHEKKTTNTRGCGCFLITLLLVFLMLGGAFFAAPFWPDRFGGASILAAREWLTGRGTVIMNYFAPPADPVQTSYHIPPHDESREAVPYYTVEPELFTIVIPTIEPSQPGEQQQPTESEPLVTALPFPELNIDTGSALPPLDTEFLPPLPNTTEPEITPAEPGTAETQVSTYSSVALSADNQIRGYVAAANVRIRSSPDTSTLANVLGFARQGERFTVLERGTGSSAGWYFVVYDNGNRRGWTSGSLLNLEDN